MLSNNDIQYNYKKNIVTFIKVKLLFNKKVVPNYD